MSDKNLLIFGIIGIIAVMALSYILFPGVRHIANEPSSEFNAVNQTAVTTTNKTNNILTAENQDITKQTSDYSENVAYPKLINMQDVGAQDKVNKVIKDFILGQVANFEEQIMSEDISEGFQDYLQIQYLITLLNESLVSISFSVSENFGGAHPNNYTMTFNYDIAGGRNLALGDILQKGVSYQKIIGGICQEKLIAQLGQDEASKAWIEEGTSPQTGNFENFGLTGASLVIYFNPDEVGPYAMGVQTIEIPFTDINQYLDTQGILKDLI